MARPDDDDNGGAPEPEPAEVLIDGERPASSDWYARPPGWRIGLVAAVVVAFVLGLVIGRTSADTRIAGTPSSSPTTTSDGAGETAATPMTSATTPSASSTAGTSATSRQAPDSVTSGAPATPTTPSAQPSSSPMSLAWLEPSTDWGLFAYSRGERAVLRIRPLQGTVTRTPVPLLSSGGPVSFVVRAHAAFVHPRDFVPGYVIPDGEPAQPSAPTIPDGGVLAPGPKPNLLWTENDAGNRTYRLVTVRGEPAGPVVDPPEAAWGFARPDGSGYLLMHRNQGTFQMGDGSPRLVTTNRVVATGPETWVVVECDPPTRCHLVVVDQDTGDRQPITEVLSAGAVLGGSTSPDGTDVALLTAAWDASQLLILTDPTSEGASRVSVDLAHEPLPRFHGGMFAWSPNGRWLFVAGLNGITAVETATGDTHPLDLPIDAVSQLAVRP